MGFASNATRLLLGVALWSGCSYVTLEQGQKMEQQIVQLQQSSQASNQELADKLSQQSQELTKLLEEARRLTSSLADSSQRTERLTTDVIILHGKLVDVQRAVDALQKQFTDYRASTDSRVDQLGSTVSTIKTPPLPETPDGLLSEGQKRLEAKQYPEARRMFESFLSRFPSEARAAKAQAGLGEVFFQEARYANAIIAFKKVVDNYPKSDEIEHAMYKAGMAFTMLKKCAEAKIYFQELLRVFPRTKLKVDANEQLKELTRQAKNKSYCET